MSTFPSWPDWPAVLKPRPDRDARGGNEFTLSNLEPTEDGVPALSYSFAVVGRGELCETGDWRVARDEEGASSL
jgi:hypothetical protein